jgi:hypothetical protein
MYFVQIFRRHDGIVVGYEEEVGMLKARIVTAAAALALLGSCVVVGSAATVGAASPVGLASIVSVTGFSDLYSITSSPSGHVYSEDGTTGDVVELAANLNPPKVLGIDSHDPIGITYRSGVLYLSNKDGSISTMPAGGGAVTTIVAVPSVTGTEAGGQQPTFDAAGDLFIANYDNNVIGEVAAGASTEVTAGLTLPSPCGAWGTLVVSKYLYISCYGNGKLLRAKLPIPAGGEKPVVIPTLPITNPGQIVVGPGGALYMASETTNGKLLRVPTNGTKSSYVALRGTQLVDPWGLTFTHGAFYTLLWTKPQLIAKIVP